MSNNINVNEAFTENSYHDADSVTITVAGRGNFPFDQLRLYSLVPVTDANILAPDYRETEDRNVELRFAYPTNYQVASSCADRFASFGWTVSECFAQGVCVLPRPACVRPCGYTRTGNS